MSSLAPAIVIPVHRGTPTQAEAASLSQLVKVLGTFPICLVAPESLNPAAYQKIAPNLDIRYFEDLWFRDFRSHQKLMISRQFYERFSHFSHMLIYHLDSWVFRDDLLHWCMAPYDYIGAPWRSGFDEIGHPVFPFAGNGGFSLRRIPAMLETLSLFNHRRYRSGAELIRELRYRDGFSRLRHLLSLPLKLCGIRNSLKHFHDSYVWTEDKFWAYSAVLANPEFRVAPVDVAKRFAFEASPQWLYEDLQRTLPFGCHAWRYEQAFWCEKIGLPRDQDFRPHNEDGIPLSRES
jgi:hypothetical protein